MAEGGKFFGRPKVRFCQWEGDDEDQERGVNEKILSIARKPTIRNIVRVDKPYKIVVQDENYTSKDSPPNEENSEKFKYSTEKNSDEERKQSFEDRENIFGHTKRVLNDFNEEDSFASTLRKFSSMTSAERRSPVEPSREYNHLNYQASSVDSSLSSKEGVVQNPKVVEVEVHAADFPETEIQNGTKTSFAEMQTFKEPPSSYKPEEYMSELGNTIPNQIKFAEDSIIIPQEEKNLSPIQEESLDIDVPPQEDFSESEPESLDLSEGSQVKSKKAEPKSPRKTFKSSPLKRQLNSVNRLSNPHKSLKKSACQEIAKNRLPSVNKCRTRPLGFIPRTAAKPKVCGVMPCMKAKFGAKGKTSPVKKRVFRNVVVPPKNIGIVEPGVIRVRKELKVDFEEEPKLKSHIVSAEKLSRPEYNSIMCTINKLKEVQKENIITDVEHLPPIYKSLVNGKVSSLLDFPPDEAIFKNLINLSIEESQLPQRFTRSKDPEPRQRDVVPQLSDFFMPKYASEYCTAVCMKPRSPEPMENWSAFRISDKIRSWKWNMDYVH